MPIRRACCAFAASGQALQQNLMHPDLVAEFVKEFHAEINRQRRDAELLLGGKHRELEKTRQMLDGLIEAIAEGFRAPSLQVRLDELEQHKLKLESEIASAPGAAPRLHPNLAEIYRKKVASLRPDRRRSRFCAVLSNVSRSVPLRTAAPLNSWRRSPIWSGFPPGRKAGKLAPTEVQ